jgi:hypothetical protein
MMSVQNDSNDSIFFSSGVEKECFFSFYKLTSYPFFYYLLSSPNRSTFFIYLFHVIRPRPFIYVFSFFFVFVFVFFYFMSLSAFVVSDVYRSLCTCESVNYMSCPCLLFFFFFIPSFFSFYGCC